MLYVSLSVAFFLLFSIPVESDMSSCDKLPGGLSPYTERLPVEDCCRLINVPSESVQRVTVTADLCSADADTAEWTFLFYDDSDFTNSYKPLSQFASEAYSTDNVNVFVLEDTDVGPAYLYYIPETGDPVVVEEWGEVNMGDWETLHNLIVWGKTNHPAERYMVTMYDHGGGWWGACLDVTSGNDILSMDEIQDAIEGAGGIDILAFTAPCLMGALESAYELRDCVDVYIGSEDLSGYIYWFDIMDDICDLLNNSSTLSTEEVGCLIIDLVETNFAAPYDQQGTMSAIDQAGLNNMVTVFDQLCVYMTDHIDELGSVIQETRESAWYLGAGYYVLPEIDFYDFLSLYLEAEEDPFVQARIQEIIVLFEPLILSEIHGELQGRTHGLSIYFPLTEEESYLELYGSINLDFADNTNWNEFLEAYYEWQLTGIEGDAASNQLSIHPGCNPCSGTTELFYSCSVSGRISIDIRDITGRTVRSYTESAYAGEPGSFVWEGLSDSGASVPGGVYIVSISDLSGNTASVKVVMVE
ncbi:MAG: hypothetical protein K8S62_00010 [Candidatus Sabulitectum sp.]|nr:hypothetical protein [Candidatus Sabulitectum sp.]